MERRLLKDIIKSHKSFCDGYTYQRDSAESHSQRYIPVSNGVIRDIGKIGGVDCFRVYVNLLLNINWKNEITTSLKILLSQIDRERQYQDKLKEQLMQLSDNDLIALRDTNGDRITEIKDINYVFKIKLKKQKGAATRIRCVNEGIFKLKSKNSNNTLLSVYARIKSATLPELKYSEISLETISEDLGIAAKTVNQAVNFLSDNGYLKIMHKPYNPDVNKRGTNRYRVYDYQSTAYKAKLGLIAFPKIMSQEFKQESERDKLIEQLISNPKEYCPCILNGALAAAFYERHSPLYRVFYDAPKKPKYVVNLADQLCGIKDDYRAIIIPSKISEPMQGKLLEMLDYVSCPIFF